MIEDEIRRRVGTHYDSGKGILMLSDLGVELRAASLWPLEGDTRSLSAAVEATPGVVVMRHPTQKAFITVVPEGREELARDAIEQRSVIQLLRRMPRPVLIAFCLDVDAEVPVHLRIRPPFRYAVGDGPVGDAGYLPIEPHFRIRGLFADDAASLEDETALQVGNAIIGWCNEHGVDPAELARHGHSLTNTQEQKAKSERGVSGPVGENALERLLAAQDPEVASRVIVPIDIAIALTRLR